MKQPQLLGNQMKTVKEGREDTVVPEHCDVIVGGIHLQMPQNF